VCDDHLVVSCLDTLDAGHRFDCAAGGPRASVETGHDEVIADAALEIVGRALGHDASTVDDADPVAELVSLLEVLGGEEDRHVGARG
jgi:aspartate ammonia-lyase